MRISKMVFNFVVLIAVASIAGTAKADESCNRRTAASLFDKTHPPEPRKVSKSPTKSSGASKTKSSKGHK